MALYKSLRFRLRKHLRWHLRWLRPKITGKLIWYLLLVSILPLFIIVATSLDITRQTVLSIARDYSTQLLANQRDYMKLMSEQVENLAANIAGVEDIGEVLATVDINAGFDRSPYHELSTQAKISYILHGYSNLKGLVSIELFSYLGYHFHVGEPLSSQHVNEAERLQLYEAALMSDRPLLWAGMRKNVNLGSQQQHVLSAVKIIHHYFPKTQQNIPVGMLAIYYSPQYLHQHFAKLNFGKDSRFFVVDQHNRLIFHADQSKIGQDLDPALSALLKSNRVRANVELDGENLLFSQAKITSNDWRVILLVPERTLLLPMRDLVRNGAILLILCFLTIALVAYRYTRSVVLPIKAISSGFRHVQSSSGASDLRPLEVPKNKDEIAELVSWFNVFVDSVKARELYEQQLLQAKLAADQANQSKSEFLANMSHEIRTPMNAILGMTQLALHAGDEQTRNNYLQKANRAAWSLLTIINDILDISKIEAGKITLENLALTLHSLIAEVAEVFCGSLQQKQLEMLFDVDPALLHLPLEGDPLRLRQVLLNLVGNAIKFSEQGEIVLLIELTGEDEKQVELHCSVRDNGIGISPEQQAGLFQQFSQADTSTTRRYGGTGLGLSICKHLLELMGSRIGVRSKVGEGSEFFFSLRLNKHLAFEPGAEASAALPPILPRSALPPSPQLPPELQLLIVDDNPHTRKVLCSFAAWLGVKVHACANLPQAQTWLQDALQERQVNPEQLVLLLDYPLPADSSLHCLQALRNLKGCARLPAIWLHTTDLCALGRSATPWHVAKPVLPEQLHLILLQACSLSPATSAAASHLDMADYRQKLAGSRILVVEDNLMNQEVVCAFLQDIGIKPDLAQDGEQALQMVAHKQYDLLLMDCQMPVMDGYTATRQLRAQPAHAKLPILALTAHALLGEKEKCLAAGMNEHLTKPINPQLLYAALLRWIHPSACQAAQQAEFDAASAKLDAAVEHTMLSLQAQQQQQQEMHAHLQARAVEQNAPSHFLPQLALDNLLGNMSLYQRMGQLFKTEAEQFTPHFTRALQTASTGTERDWEDARRIAHTMKGSANTIGAPQLHHSARMLELACQTRQVEECRRLAVDCQTEIIKVLQALDEYWQQHASTNSG